MPQGAHAPSDLTGKGLQVLGTPQELGSIVSRGLGQLIKAGPANGWQRAHELADRKATVELLQLRRHVGELEGELAKARTSAPAGPEGPAQGDDKQWRR